MACKKNKKNTDVAGFSLLEILVAVTIMGLAYVAILQSFSLSARNITFMDQNRSELLINSLAFEKQLINMGLEQGGEVLDNGEVLVSGSAYLYITSWTFGTDLDSLFALGGVAGVVGLTAAGRVEHGAVQDDSLVDRRHVVATVRQKLRPRAGPRADV